MRQCIVSELRSIFGAGNVIADEDALSHSSLDMSPRNLIRRERPYPTASVIVRPHGDAYAAQLKQLIELALSQEPKLRLIPRGGGSGVCGALNAAGGEVVIDFSLLRGVRIVESQGNHVLELEPGVFGEDIDRALKEHDLPLEHGYYPASYNISTFGGWVQSAGSGQYSMEFGTIGDIVQRLEVIDGTGEYRSLQGHERTQAIGMEGTSCLITRGTMPLVQVPQCESYLTFRFHGVEDVVSFLRELHQFRDVLREQGAAVYAVRCYDWFDTTFVAKPHKGESSSSGSSNGSSKRLQYAAERWLASHGRMIYSAIRMLEGVRRAPWTCLVYVRARDEHSCGSAGGHIESLVRKHRGSVTNSQICRTWHENRFKLGYEKLVVRYEAGILADTFECTPTWDTAAQTYEAVRSTLSKYGVVGAHIGMDLEGPYWYFTFALPHRNELAHQEAWTGALNACIDSGSRTNHHHGIGELKAGKHNELAPFANGSAWYENAKETKRNMDPHRILNPSNLF